MHVLVLPKWYPGRNDPQLGDFIRKQMLAAAEMHAISVVYPCPVASLPQAHEQELTVVDGAWELRCYYRSSTVALAPLRKLLNFHRYRKALLAGVRRAVRERGKPDLVHAHILTRPAYAAWRLSRQWHIPFLISEQSSTHLSGRWAAKSTLAKALDRLLVRRAAALVAVSPHLARALEKLGPSFPVSVVPNVLPISEAPPPPAGPPAHFLMVADLVDRTKNIGGVLRALQIARNKGHDLHLDVIGGGPDRGMLESLATTMGISAHVSWLGRLPNTEVLERMARTGTVVINSNYETFSVVTGEALALGKPVIASRCGGPEAFITPENGMLVPIGDDDSLAAALVAMCERHAAFPPASIKASLGNSFSKEAVAKQLDAVYQRVLGHG